MKTLNQCFVDNGVDKQDWLHGYSRHYEPLFEPLRDKPITLLEIGVYQGASIRAWLEFFTQAHIAGVDVLPIPVGLVNCHRYHHFNGDQTDGPFLANVCNHVDEIDIVIDDGDHQPAHQAISFETLWPYVAPGGLYIVEDTHPAHDPLHGHIYHDGAKELLWRIVEAINWHGCKYHGRPFPESEPTNEDRAFDSLTIHRGLLIIRKAA